MPFDAGVRGGFVDRDAELGSLMRLVGADGGAVPETVLLTGARGIGKTALIKRLHHELFWGDTGAFPFYYPFRRSSLDCAGFSRDFFSRFIRQLASFLKRDPSAAVDMTVPAEKILHGLPATASICLSRIYEDLSDRYWKDDPAGRLAAAAAMPRAVSSCIGRRIVVMLDDFHLADGIYGRARGDMEGAAGVFAGLFGAPNISCIVTGTPESRIERVFSDDALLGSARKMRIGPLPDEDAYRLFTAACRDRGAESVSEDCKPLMRHLAGTPLYIKNIAAAAAGTGAGEITPRVLTESYGREVTDGETYSYWSSVIRAQIREPRTEPLALRLLVRLAEMRGSRTGAESLALGIGADVRDVEAALDALSLAGLPPETGGAARDADTVLDDFIFGLASRGDDEFPRTHPAEAVAQRRFGGDIERPVCYDLIIPNASEAELVAVKAAEQICAGAGLEGPDAGKLTMALIEACINAMEHGSGQDDRIGIRYRVYPERVEVYVESTGAMQTQDVSTGAAGTMPGVESHRGRGFALMRGFVDDLRVERAGDNTRVVLVKTIKR